MKLKVKKGATVEVIAGAHKGRRGSVLEVDHVRLRIRVQGIKMLTHYGKKGKDEGLVKKEGFIDYSNVKLMDSGETKTTKKKATRSKA